MLKLCASVSLWFFNAKHTKHAKVFSRHARDLSIEASAKAEGGHPVF